MQRVSTAMIAQKPKHKKPYIYQSIPIICFLNGHELLRLKIFYQNPKNNQQLSHFIVYINTNESQYIHLGSIEAKYKQVFGIDKTINISIRLFKANKYGKKITRVIRGEMIEKVIKYREKPFYFMESVQVQPQQRNSRIDESKQSSFSQFQSLTYRETIVQILYVDANKTQTLEKSQFLFGEKQSISDVKKFFCNELRKQNLKFNFCKNSTDFYNEKQLQKRNEIGMLMNEENIVNIHIITEKKKKGKQQDSNQSFNSEQFDNLSKSKKSISSSAVDLQSSQESRAESTSHQTLIAQHKKNIKLSLKLSKENSYKYEINYLKYKNTTLNEFLQQMFSQDQINDCPKYFTGIIFDKKAYFRQTITFKNILQLCIEDFNRWETSQNNSISIQIAIFGNPRLFEVLENLQNQQKKVNSQKKVKDSQFKPNQFRRSIQAFQNNQSLSSYQKQNLLFKHIHQAQSNLQNYRGKNAQNKVFFIITEQQFYFKETIKNIKQNDVVTFPYFIIASKKKYFELPDYITHQTVVVEISTLSGKKLPKQYGKSDRILLLPWTNYLITQIQNVQTEKSSFICIHMRQMPFPLENKILFWVDDNIQNNFCEIRAIQKYIHQTYDIITFETSDQFLIWMELFYQIIQTFAPGKELKLIQDNLRYEKNKDKKKIPKYCALSLIKQLEATFPQIFQLKKLSFVVYIKQKKTNNESPEQETFQSSRYNSKIVTKVEEISHFLNLPNFDQYWEGQFQSN